MASLAHQHQELKLKIRLDVKFGHKFAKKKKNFSLLIKLQINDILKFDAYTGFSCLTVLDFMEKLLRKNRCRKLIIIFLYDCLFVV